MEENGLSCASPTFCVAAGDNPSDTPVTWTFDGTGWSSPVSFESSTDYNLVFAVSCPVVSSCVGVDDFGGSFTFDGKAWKAGPPDGLAEYAPALSCASSSFCVAQAGGFTSTYNGSTWTPADSGNPPCSLECFDPSCPSSTFCVSIGSTVAATFTGKNWSAPVRVVSSASTAQLQSVSCVSSRFCVAVDDAGNAYTYDGTSWSAARMIDPGDELAAVSCGSASFCVAIGDSRSVTFNGTGWTRPTDESFQGGFGTSLDCPSTRFCVAAAGSFGTSAAGPDDVAIYAADRHPVNLVRPVIGGSHTVGGTARVRQGTWSNKPTRFSYLWVHCPSNQNLSLYPIATGPSFRLRDAGETVCVIESATNADGTATAISAPVRIGSGAGTTPSGSPTLKIGSVTAHGATLNVTVSCTGKRGRCARLTVNATTVEHLSSNKLKGLTDAGQSRPRHTVKRVTVLAAHVTLNVGSRRMMHLQLNALGRRLLRRFRRVPATVTIRSSGKVRRRDRVRFAHPTHTRA
jgi:hypothetical protein